MNIIIFGGPGSGKGTQSDLLIKKYGLFHISTGDVLRAEIKAGSELGALAESYISKGQLVPDEVIIGMLANVLDSNKEATGVIFDGFPRTIPQAQALKSILTERGKEIDAVVALEVEENELVARLLKRGEISGRSDDNLETIKKRLDVYFSQTAPLVDFYKQEGLYKGILGMGSIEEIFARITDTLEGLK